MRPVPSRKQALSCKAGVLHPAEVFTTKRGCSDGSRISNLAVREMKVDSFHFHLVWHSIRNPSTLETDTSTFTMLQISYSLQKAIFSATLPKVATRFWTRVCWPSPVLLLYQSPASQKKVSDEKSVSCPHQKTADGMSASPSAPLAELERGCSLCSSCPSTKICKRSAYSRVDTPSAELADNYQLWFPPPLKLISTARGFGSLQAPVTRGPTLQPALFNYPLLFCPANVRSQRVTDALPQRRHPITEEDVGSYGDLGSNA